MPEFHHPVKGETASRPAGLYVHVPFCLSKCAYCGFYSITDTSRIGDWAAAVKKEAAFYRSSFPVLDTLYWGGGTPSLLPEAILGDLMETLNRLFSLSPGSEITLEANPNDLTLATVRRLKSFGINRVSLGVQSLVDRDLLFLGRRHRASEALQAVEWIWASGFPSLSLDLIYGLPNQSLRAWMELLEKTVRLQPDHLSCYELTAEPGTPLDCRRKAGEIVLPGEGERAMVFLETSRFLRQHGYTHYEVSNFARGSAWVSRHNRKYWEGDPYLGLGPAAHSSDGRRRWWNTPSLERYLERLSEARRPLEGVEWLSEEQNRLESLMLGFRTQAGVRRMDLNLDPERLEVLKFLEQSGRIQQKADRLVPTPLGFLLADRIALFFS